MIIVLFLQSECKNCCYRHLSADNHLTGTESPVILFAVMNSVKSLSSITICLCILLSLCLLGSSKISD